MSRFPSVWAKDLEGRSVRIPDDLPPTPRIVILAFERWQQALIESWEPTLQALEARCRELSVWEIPALSRLYLPMRGFIDGGMRAGIVDEADRRHTLTAYTDLGALAGELELESFETIYLMLLAPDGTIIWRAEGGVDEEKSAALTRAVDEFACCP